MEEAGVHFTHCEGLRWHIFPMIPWKTCLNFLFSLRKKKKKTFDKDYYKLPCKDYFSPSRLSSMLMNLFEFLKFLSSNIFSIKNIFNPFILQGAYTSWVTLNLGLVFPNSPMEPKGFCIQWHRTTVWVSTEIWKWRMWVLISPQLLVRHSVDCIIVSLHDFSLVSGFNFLLSMAQLQFNVVPYFEGTFYVNISVILRYILF